MRLHSQGEHTLPARNTVYFLLMLAALFAAGCAAVKKPPVGVPFVYDNKISLKSTKINKEEHNLLVEKLYTYLDDSLQVPQRSILGFTQRISPPVFDSANITRSITFMNGYLNSIGYYGARFDTVMVKMDTLTADKPQNRQIRVTTSFAVTLGKSIRVDTLVYNFKNPLMQRLADSAAGSSLLKKNTNYSKEVMAGELDRLSALFRNNGYLRMSRSALLAEADTTDPSLISLDNDPIEQLLEAQRRKEDPRISLRVFERPGVDSAAYLQYYIDSVFIYPETKITDDPDSLMKENSFNTAYGKTLPIIIKEREAQFQAKLIRRNNYMVPGRMYNDLNYFRTINNYWRMGPWQQVDVKTLYKYDSLAKADFYMFLYPAKRQNFQVDLEGSQNNNISVSNSLSGRFLAIALNLTHRSRNLLRAGIQSVSSARVGFEVNSISKSTQFFQSFVVSGNQSFSVPKLLWPFGFLDRRLIDNTNAISRKGLDAARTQLTFSALYTDRFQFYKQINFTAGPQWEVRIRRNTYTFSVPNFESFSIKETDSLVAEINKNPALRYAFTPGNILSVKFAFERSMRFKSPKHAGYFRVATELSPLKFVIFNRESFRFFRMEGQIVHSVQNVRSSMHYRAYAGVGWNFKDDPATGKIATLPYYRQYVAGGSNSMRGWGLRQLGVGRSIVSDTTTGFTDRFGDVQIEMNAEYRFKLFRLFGFGFGGTLFTDIGNVWNHTDNADGEGQFRLNRLYRDMAMCIGTGIRWDVSYLVIRLDAGFKLKDPVRAGDGWIQKLEWKSDNRLGGYPRNNVAFQFGIGYPF
jgi:hypothetical protein